MADGTQAKRPRQATATTVETAIPLLTEPLRQRIASSPVDEFVAAHGASDVFRELVQNEFDAEGSDIGIRLTGHQLEITGTGKAIPPKGWGRLSVLIGTGEVLGDPSGEVITPKESSIGSKNLGMRSLFHFGDRIHVRSSGQMAVLDFKEFGTARQPDPPSKGRKGILIQVPFRTEKLRRFEPFSIERERKALDDIQDVLFPTLVKLALTGRRTGVRSLTITSERLGRRLVWKQSAETLRTKVAQVTGVRRTGRSQTETSDGKRRRQDYEELEFSRLVDIEPKFEWQDFPAYFRSGGQVRISVSMALRNGKPVTVGIGHCYYPLQAGQARTGCALSISAPFQLDAERTRVIDTDWNTWLASEAADLVVDLLGSDWFPRFGADAFKLVLRQGSETHTFADQILERLKIKPCWPNAAGTPTEAKALVTVDHELLRGHLDTGAYLHADLTADLELATLASACGAKRFTVNSLVRLRCGDDKAAGLQTKLAADEANYHYTGLPLSPDVQHRTAAALTHFQRRLTQNNRLDLADTPSTLSASGALASARKLIRVEPDMWDACPEPLASRLHPTLYDDMSVARHCRTFELSRWIQEAAERAAAGRSDEIERDALYRHLLAPGTKLSSRLVGVIRKSPVMRDDVGGWARPDALAVLPAKDATLLNAVVRAPASIWRQRSDLLERLAIRRKTSGDDLIAMAGTILKTPQSVGPFEDLLRRHVTLLAPKVVSRLSNLAFLLSRAGDVAAPAQLHLPTNINVSCLSEDKLLTDDKPLYRRLGCPAQPTSEVLLGVIDRARDTGQAPASPSQLYPALVEALRAERLAATALAHRPILYVKDRFASPHETLVALRPPRCLEMTLPVVRPGNILSDAYVALGAQALARSHHWASFFVWIDKRLRAAHGKVGALEKSFLREAYRVRGLHGLPPELPSSVLCLLSSEATAHSVAELEAGRFVEDDFPDLAKALLAAKAEIAFADGEESSRIFFRSLGIRPLSDKGGEGRVVVGALAPAPNWFQTKTAARALEQLHRPDFAQGVAELAYARQVQSPGFQPSRSTVVRKRLLAIQKVAFSADLQRYYQVGKRVGVPADAAIDDETLFLRPPRFKSEFDHIVALELARLAGATRLADVRALASTLLPLLQAERPAEVLAYLSRLGIKPTAWTHNENEPDARAEEAALTREQIAESLMSSVHIAVPSPTTPPAPAPPSSTVASPPTTPPALPTVPAQPPPLPPVDQVALAVAPPTGVAPQPSVRGPGNSWGYGSSWTPRTPAEVERDRQVGLQGEALVYRAELERVRALGYENPEVHVVWVSKDNPGADHDIRSIGADGGAIWIEVKSTTGTDGRFDWSIAEFEKALREGPRYELWRVYGAGGLNPLAKRFENPASLMKGPTLRLELGSLRAFVESK